MDWFTPLVGFIGLAIGLGYQEYRIRRERKDKYKDMAFEKRLVAHQGAYYWCMRLSKLVLPHGPTTVENLGVGIKELSEAMEWINKNALYLDRDSRLKVNSFFVYVGETFIKYYEYYKKDEGERKNINIEEETAKLLEHGVKALTSIQRGIGLEYLPEQKISIGYIEVEKAFNKLVKQLEELMGEQENKAGKAAGK